MACNVRPYILGNASTLEYERLDLMSKILDPRTRASLLELGLREGWNCLEIGGGNGSMSAWLAQRVGQNGSVTSADINPQLIELVDAPNLTVRQLDVRTDDLPPGEFDLVMCRALLHHISEDAPRVLSKMAAAVKPGGWLFVCEPDFSLVRTCEPQVWRDAWDGIIKWGLAQGVDWNIGRRMPSMVAALGYGQPEAKTEVPNIRGTTRDALFYQLFFQFERERILNSGFVDAPTLDAASALLGDPNCWLQCWMLTSVWVRK